MGAEKIDLLPVSDPQEDLVFIKIIQEQPFSNDHTDYDYNRAKFARRFCKPTQQEFRCIVKINDPSSEIDSD